MISIAFMTMDYADAIPGTMAGGANRLTVHATRAIYEGMATTRPPAGGHDDPGTSAMSLAQMLQGMAAIGLDTDRIRAAAGVPRVETDGVGESVAIDVVVAVWRAAAQEFGRPTIGLHVGANVLSGALLDYLAATSSTMREALGHVVRYFALATRHVSWALRPRDTEGLWLFEHTFNRSAGPMAPALREFSVGLANARVREWGGTPREIWLPHAPLGPLDEYRRVLGCPVHFERGCTGLAFDDATLDRPSRRSDAQLLRFLSSHADQVLAQLPSDTSLRGRVHRAVATRLRDGEPDIGAVARALALSERSLQRRLREEGTSFRDIVETVRRQQADVYLGDRELSVSDVAYLLGYSEPGAFIRAFKRWTGRTPRAIAG